MAIHQVQLDPESRDITTFARPNGFYCYKHLLFGINMATEKFQHIIWQILKDCLGAQNSHDDIHVAGASQEEHDH